LPGAKREMIVRPAGREEEKKEHKLYVGMLSRKSTEDDVRKLFEPYGDVLEIFLMRDKDTGASKGCGFIKFATRDESLRAINALHGRKRDKDSPSQLQVRFAQTKQEKVQQQKFLSRWPFQYGAAAAAAGAGGFGFGGLPGFPGDLGALGQLSGPFGQNQIATGPVQTGPSGANLFIYNLPESYDDNDLASLFSNFGQVISTKVQRDRLSGASKGYGFVSFDSVLAAQAAISSMDGFVIGSKKLAVRVKKGDAGADGGGNGGRPSNSYSPY